MNQLYKELAPVYEAMYQTFIDYQAEYQLYSNLLQKYSKKQVLEIGCGTGNLAPYFQEEGLVYLGIDLSPEMIQLAKEKVPTGNFICGDVRKLQLPTPVESMIMTARTISYLLTNQAVLAAFAAMAKNLVPSGIICFDFIDANQFIPIVTQSDEIIHTAEYKGTTYVRKSIWQPHIETNMGFKWDSIYYQKDGAQLIKIGEDHSYLRTFTKDELILFLELQGFEVKEMIARETYAFPTYVLVAER